MKNIVNNKYLRSISFKKIEIHDYVTLEFEVKCKELFKTIHSIQSFKYEQKSEFVAMSPTIYSPSNSSSSYRSQQNSKMIFENKWNLPFSCIIIPKIITNLVN